MKKEKSILNHHYHLQLREVSKIAKCKFSIFKKSVEFLHTSNGNSSENNAPVTSI